MVADTVENWDSYDTVFIGYPTGGQIFPWQCTAFLTSMTSLVRPSSRSMSTMAAAFSRTIQTIGELEPDATVIENGFTVSEQTVADAAPDVAAWLEELGYLDYPIWRQRTRCRPVW